MRTDFEGVRTREVQHTRLGRGKCTLQPDRHKPKHGSNIDDRPPAPFHHSFGNHTRAIENPVQIDAKNAPPFLIAELIYGTTFLSNVYAGIIDENVDGTQLLLYGSRHRID